MWMDIPQLIVGAAVTAYTVPSHCGLSMAFNEATRRFWCVKCGRSMSQLASLTDKPSVQRHGDDFIGEMPFVIDQRLVPGAYIANDIALYEVVAWLDADHVNLQNAQTDAMRTISPQEAYLYRLIKPAPECPDHL